MSGHGPATDSIERPDGLRGIIAFFVSAALLIVGLVLAIERGVPTAIVAASVSVYLLVFGIAFIACRRRDARTYAQWRDAMPCYMSVHDRDLRIVETNESLRHDFGECEGRFCYVVYKGRETPCPECTVREVMADGQVRSHKAVVTKRNGEKAHIVSTTSPQRNSQGEIVGAVEMFTDITEIETLRIELEKSRRDYRHLFDRLPSYASVLGRDLRVLAANALYRRDFGEVSQGRCFEICKGRSMPCPECLVAKTFEDGRVHQSEESLTTVDGRQVNVIVYSMPIVDDEGEIVSVMEVFTDITEVKRLESKLALMGRAVAGIAHRIKNIVMGLEGGIYVVNTGMKASNQEQITDGWEMVEANVSRVSRIVKDLLYCSKERPPSRKVDLDPGEIVREVRDLYAERAADFDIDLVAEVSDDLPRGSYDPDGLHSLLLNLVANATDACRFDQDQSKPRHRITIRCGRGDDSSTVLEVADTGPGIPEDDTGKVFQEFFSTKGTEGTGIGLLVVKTVAEEHGGRVTFATEARRGTTFRVVFPAADAAVAGEGPAG